MSFVAVDMETLPASKSSGTVNPDTLTKGDGFTVSGSLVEMRNHSYQETGSKKYFRYVALVVDVSEAAKRVFENGKEKEQINEYSLNVARTGYLNTSYDKTKTTRPNSVTVDQLCQAISGSSSALPTGLCDERKTQLHPTKTARLEFWGDSNQIKAIALKNGDTIHLKTNGNSILVQSVSKTEFRAGENYAGEDVGSGWAGKMVAPRHQSESLVPKEAEGVDEEEWDD